MSCCLNGLSRSPPAAITWPKLAHASKRAVGAILSDRRAASRCLGSRCGQHAWNDDQSSQTLMNIDRFNAELAQKGLPPLTGEQIAWLHDTTRIESAASMLLDLVSRSGIPLPQPDGVALAGAFPSLEEALDAARIHAAQHSVVAIDEMATDDSRSTGEGNEFYVTGFGGADAALALAAPERWTAYWVRGTEQQA